MRIGDMLVKVGLIDELQLQSALAHQKQWGGRLGDVLIDNGFVDEMMLYKGLAHQLKVPLISLPDTDVDRASVQAVPVELCRQHELLPIKANDREVTVAISDPSNMAAIDEVGFRTGLRVNVVLAPSREIEWMHRRFFSGERAPCPAPKTARGRIATGEMEVIQPGGASTHRVPTNPAMATLPPDPTLHLQEPIADIEPDSLAELKERLDGSTHLLRLVVDTCVQRGIFTREEYLAKVRQA
jgi:type IV pilus assembly protein PilB